MAEIQRILCALDAQHGAEGVLACACAIARSFGARVDAVHVRQRAEANAVQPFAAQGPVLQGWLAAHAVEGRLNALVAALDPDLPVPLRIISGRPEAAILDQSSVHGSDLIVLGSRRPLSLSRAAGGLADEVASRATCPVLTVPTGTTVGSLSRILLPVDFSQATERAVEWALTLARRFGSSVHVVHAVGGGSPPVRSISKRDPGNEFTLGHALVYRTEQRFRSVGVSATSSLVESAALHAIVRFRESETSDLVVMGMHDHEPRRWSAAGTVASVRDRVSVPVLSVMTPESEMPLLRGRFSESDGTRARRAASSAA